MGRVHNRQIQTDKRKELRNNQTRAEWLLWMELKSNQLGYRFRRQFGVGMYILDFYCPKLHLGIELDGSSHFTKEGWVYDDERSRYLTDKGIYILRFTNEEVYCGIESVIQAIKQTFPKQDPPDPTSSPPLYKGRPGGV